MNMEVQVSTEVKPRKKARKRVANRPPSKSRTKTKAPVKKKPASKTRPPAKKAATTRKKPAAKKTAARKAPAKKTAAKKKSGGGGFHRELDEHGFVVGGDSSTIASILMDGGADRNDINAQVADAIGTETRNGTERNIPALVSGVLKRLEEQGYTVESEWRLVAPTRRKRKR